MEMNLCLPILLMVAFSMSLLAPLLFSPRLETESQQKARRLGMTESNRSHMLKSQKSRQAVPHEMTTVLKNPTITSGDHPCHTSNKLRSLTSSGLVSENKVTVKAQNFQLKFAGRNGNKNGATTANIASLSASVAILLGALTARRIIKRRQELLGGLFEQESNSSRIADELAYDVAYTTSASDVGYGSFASPWTGDLEKFDV